jgi:hypothetical protein
MYKIKSILIYSLSIFIMWSCVEKETQKDESKTIDSSTEHNYSQDWDNFKEAILTRDKKTVITFVSNENKTLKYVVELTYDYIFDDVFIDVISNYNYENLKDDELNGKPCKSFMIVYYKNEKKVEKGSFFYFEETPIGLRMIEYISQE